MGRAVLGGGTGAARMLSPWKPGPQCCQPVGDVGLGVTLSRTLDDEQEGPEGDCGPPQAA